MSEHRANAKHNRNSSRHSTGNKIAGLALAAVATVGVGNLAKNVADKHPSVDASSVVGPKGLEKHALADSVAAKFSDEAKALDAAIRLNTIHKNENDTLTTAYVQDSWNGTPYSVVLAEEIRGASDASPTMSTRRIAMVYDPKTFEVKEAHMVNAFTIFEKDKNGKPVIEHGSRKLAPYFSDGKVVAIDAVKDSNNEFKFGGTIDSLNTHKPSQMAKIQDAVGYITEIGDGLLQEVQTTATQNLG